MPSSAVARLDRIRNEMSTTDRRLFTGTTPAREWGDYRALGEVGQKLLIYAPVKLAAKGGM
jgi:hypothetical protein